LCVSCLIVDIFLDTHGEKRGLLPLSCYHKQVMAIIDCCSCAEFVVWVVVIVIDTSRVESSRVNPVTRWQLLHPRDSTLAYLLSFILSEKTWLVVIDDWVLPYRFLPSLRMYEGMYSTARSQSEIRQDGAYGSYYNLIHQSKDLKIR
jgi:hypothetical protein